MISVDKYLGCFLGLAIGDAQGAPFEDSPVEKLLWKILGKTQDGKLRYTDDTQMAIDLATSYLQNTGVSQDHIAASFARSYRWWRGYGPSTSKLLKKIRKGACWQDVNCEKFKDGSYGNGAAMRAPVLALFPHENNEQLHEIVRKCSEITHAHPLAIEGAKLIAFVTDAVLRDTDTHSILQALPAWSEIEEYRAKVLSCIALLLSSDHFDPDVLIQKLGNGIAATESCVTAIFFALAYREYPLDVMLSHIYDLGGDTDTIGAMAGAIWGASNGSKAIDEKNTKNIENGEMIIELAEQLFSLRTKEADSAYIKAR